MDSSSSNLGSLAQSARGSSLNQARWILIVVGILTLGVQGYLIYNAPNEAKEAVSQQVRELQGKGQVADPVEVKAAEGRILAFCYVVYGCAVFLGLVFIALGVLVYAMPVVSTILGLVLYIGSSLAFGALDPPSLARGIIVKIIIVIALFKAVQAAFAYQKEVAEARDFAPES